MKKLIILISAAVAVFSCNKADLNGPELKGESIDLTIPETRVGLGEDGNYVFEGGDVIIAVATNGSVAILTNSADAKNSFSGTFSKPLEESKSINLYYNCCDEQGNVSYTQNGRPWLQAKDNAVVRDEDRHIILSAELKAPANVRSVAILSGVVRSVEFHANEASVSTFDGNAFGGEKNVSVSLKDNAAFVNVPANMAGFWMKMTNEAGDSMYKSWSSVTVDENKAVKVSEFTPASVKLNVSITGFPTSYSYYIGDESTSGKDVNAANAVTNDWMGAGKATYTIERSGIPAKLLKFKSFTLVVDGENFTRTGNEGEVIDMEATTGHTTWGQKDIKATVVYEAADGTEYTGETTVTRHITGLPYVANPPKNSGDNPWNSNYQWGLNEINFGDSSVSLAGISRAPTITSTGFHIPSDINIHIDTQVSVTFKEIFFKVRTTEYNVIVNNVSIIKQSDECKNLKLGGDGTLTKSGNTIICKSLYTMTGPSIDIYSVTANYR